MEKSYSVKYVKLMLWLQNVCVQQPCETIKHQKNLHLQSMKQNRRKLLSRNQETSSLNKTSQLHRDLCETLISANIQLNTVSNKQFINFFEKQVRSNRVYITKELFSFLLWRCFKKSQKHHQGQQDLDIRIKRCWLVCSKCVCWHTLYRLPRWHISVTFQIFNKVNNATIAKTFR